uniref:Nascent polypeptide-associated complex subunit alpha-like UBA domain-containing protein n=2 Tax=Ditylenchus dipsaci TaxID=166011 RepID=A0A915D0U4_9BILA
MPRNRIQARSSGVTSSSTVSSQEATSRMSSAVSSGNIEAQRIGVPIVNKYAFSTNNATANDEKEEDQMEKVEKHRWDAADLEKVTDFHEDKDEMNEVSKESINRWEISTNCRRAGSAKGYCGRKLIQHGGDLKAALKDIMGSEVFSLTLVKAVCRGIGIQARSSGVTSSSTVSSQEATSRMSSAVSSGNIEAQRIGVPIVKINSVNMPSPTNNATANDEKEEDQMEKVEKHRWDAADLEKVTDFHEDKDEMNEVSKESIQSLGNLKLNAQAESKKIIIRKEDVQLIVDELEVPKAIAERKLIQHGGDLKAALKDIMGF